MVLLTPGPQGGYMAVPIEVLLQASERLYKKVLRTEDPATAADLRQKYVVDALERGYLRKDEWFLRDHYRKSGRERSVWSPLSYLNEDEEATEPKSDAPMAIELLVRAEEQRDFDALLEAIDRYARSTLFPKQLAAYEALRRRPEASPAELAEELGQKPGAFRKALCDMRQNLKQAGFSMN